MLRLNLLNAQKLGVKKVLITCNKDNYASEKTIVANGGIFESLITVEDEVMKRYWITVDRELLRKELRCKIHPLNSLESYKYTVICSYYNGQWVLSKHKKRSTYETQGGRIEEGETPLECAKRELYEESGIGTHTDIYSLGLIINEIFTGVIPQGNDYKKIKDFNPEYYYLDEIVAKMIQSDIEKREKNIENIIELINRKKRIAEDLMAEIHDFAKSEINKLDIKNKSKLISSKIQQKILYICLIHLILIKICYNKLDYFKKFKRLKWI